MTEQEAQAILDSISRHFLLGNPAISASQLASHKRMHTCPVCGHAGAVEMEKLAVAR